MTVQSELLDAPFAPLIKGIYLNTIWAIQAETILNEIVGSSVGIADQKFTLIKLPVIEEEIWVNELGTLTESERKAFTERKDVEIQTVKDAEGNLTEFNLRWRPIDDLAEAPATARVYRIDRTFGQVQFGDDVRGMVPPIGKDNIRATYRAGGGAKGNVAASLINTLRTTIPFVERVTNAEAAGGGSDTELLEKALERGPQIIKHRGRAITAEDFEWITREASPSIARVRCLPTFNDKGQFASGWVTVIIVPGSADARPAPSPQLRGRVERYLRDRAANVVSFPKRIKVTGPVYIEVKVAADLYPVTIDLAPQVEMQAISRLERFLHPLTGGYQNSGWEFGRLPCLSDFYAFLEAVDGVDHIENLSMTLRVRMPSGVSVGDPQVVTEDRPVDVAMPPYTLVFSGEHKFTIKALG